MLLVCAFMVLGTVILPATAERSVHAEVNKKLGTQLTLRASTTTPTFGDSITLFGSINITTQANMFLLIQSEAYHHLGTTRMSDDPKRGVVDPDGLVHGVNNLYVAGSSVFPTYGSSNPTLNLIALTLRLGDHLKKVMA